MFGSLGLPEILVILVLALLIFGPKRLPEVGRTIGRGLSEFRRASTDLKRSVNAELSLEDDERPPTSRRPSQPIPGVGQTAAEASTSGELAGRASGTEAPAGTTPRAGAAEDSEAAEPSDDGPSSSETSDSSGPGGGATDGESASDDEPSKPAGTG